MDYLGWELERQRAALAALLGGGETADSASPAGEAAPGGGMRRPAGSGTGREPGIRSPGRYAGGIAFSPGDFPGAWEAVREAANEVEGAIWKAEGGPPGGMPGGLEPPEPVQEDGGGMEVRERRSAETGAPPPSRRYGPEGARSAPRFGTGGAAEHAGPSGGPGVRGAERETAEHAAETEMAAAAAGERHAGRSLAGGGLSPAAGGVLPPGLQGGKTAGGASASTVRGGGGALYAGGEGFPAAAGRGEPLLPFLPWSGGWESAALQAEEEARALSRAVQRDARRYDGGFTIY